MQQNIKARALTEGAVFAAITALLGIIMQYVPVLGILVYVWPSPIIVVGYRNGLKVSVISAVVASVVISIFSSVYNGLFLFILLGLPGIVMGYLLHRKMKPGAVIVIASICMSLIIFAGIAFSAYVLSPVLLGEINSMSNMIKEATEQSANIYRSMGMDEAVIQQSIDSFNALIESFKLLLPYIVLTSSVMFMFINFKFTRFILKRVGYHIEDVLHFSQWRLPDLTGKAALVLTLGLILLKQRDIQMFYHLTDNLYSLMMFVFLVLGLSVAIYYFNVLGDKLNLPKAGKNILTVIAIFMLLSLLPTIGILDTVIDIRKWASKLRGV